MTRFIGGVRAQRQWEEHIEKEEDARLRWGSESTGMGKSKQLEVFRKRIVGAPKMDEDVVRRLPKIDANKFRKQKPTNAQDSLLKLTRSKTEPISLREMRPASPKTFAMLYDGFTKEEKGRYWYLKARNHTDPELKYSFPITSTQEYGWKLGEVIRKDEIKKPVFARSRIVKDTFYTRNGIPALGLGF